MTETDRAVSPVIGVVLMVAVTVILSAVIGTAVFSIVGDVPDDSPQVSIEYDYNQTTDSVTISHTAGDEITAAQLSVVESGSSDDISLTTSGSVSAGDEIASGTYESGEEIHIVWESEDGETSVTLAQSTAP